MFRQKVQYKIQNVLQNNRFFFNGCQLFFLPFSVSTFETSSSNPVCGCLGTLGQDVQQTSVKNAEILGTLKVVLTKIPLRSYDYFKDFFRAMLSES